MKFLKAITKNLKLLMRAKSSAFIIIFGPLLIILLVGLALNKPSTYELSIGYYSPDEVNSLTESFIEELKNNKYLIIKHDNNNSCVDSIKQNSAHTCIVFPENFEMGKDGFNKVTFFVDYSRANIVYQIIDSVSKELEMKTSELSKGLTDTLLSKMSKAQKELDEDVLTIINLKTSIDNIISSVDNTKNSSESINFTLEDISFSKIKTATEDIYDDAGDLKGKGINAIELGRTYGGNLTEFETLENTINDIYNTTPESYQDFNDQIKNISDEIDTLKDKMAEGANKNSKVVTDLNNIKSSLNQVKDNSDELKGNIETTNTQLGNIEFSSAESIVSPITSEIKPVVPNTNQLVFFFPALLVLVIMFIAIMLSSTLIIMEKKSKAAFRNFTTPIKEMFFIWTTYITSFIILLVQVVVILILSYYFIKADIFTNIYLMSFVILITISTFILVGMIIGYLSSTQEAATMLSIAIGSVFLLLSNLILPIETMSESIKQFTKFNPYVVSSELLKKTFVFDVAGGNIFSDLVFLLVFMIIIAILTVIINKVSRIKLLEKSHYMRKKGKIYLPEDTHLKIGRHTIKSKQEILRVLEEMNEKEFEENIKNKNKIADWVSKTLKERKLAWKLRYKTQNEMIKVIERHLEKEARKEEKKNKKLLEAN